MKTPGKLVAMLASRCPACHQGKLFVDSNPYSRRFMAMEPKCAVCGENFKREPGFYFGAAYVSYALTVALWVSLIVALYVFDAIGIMEYDFFEDGILTIILGIVLLMVLLPVLFRLSRSMWIHMFVQQKD